MNATWPRTLSLASRLTLWYALVAFLLLTASAFLQYRLLSNDLAGEDDQLLLETLAAAARGAIPADAITSSGSMLGPHVRVLGGNCAILVGRLKPETPPVICPGPKGTEPVLRTWVAPGGRVWRSASLKLINKFGTATVPANAMWVETTLDRGTDVKVLESYRHKLFALIPVAIILSGGVGFLIARRGLAPLKSISSGLSDLTADSLGNKFEIGVGDRENPPEVEKLLASLNEMRQRLNRRFEVLARFSAELAHEFRTPIHVLKQQAEIALTHPRTADEYKEVLSSSLEEYDRLNRMIGDTLFLARVEDATVLASLSQLTPREELAAVVGFLEALAVDKGVRLVLEAELAPVIRADRTLLRRAMVNVVANAIHHTPQGGEVRVGATLDVGAVTITVSDNGNGIAQSDLAHVFDRYFRGNENLDRDGSGLGLAIVKGIMTVHNGTAGIASSPNAGTQVTLVFPN